MITLLLSILFFALLKGAFLRLFVSQERSQERHFGAQSDAICGAVGDDMRGKARTNGKS